MIEAKNRRRRVDEVISISEIVFLPPSWTASKSFVTIQGHPARLREAILMPERTPASALCEN